MQITNTSVTLGYRYEHNSRQKKRDQVKKSE